MGGASLFGITIGDQPAPLFDSREHPWDSDHAVTEQLSQEPKCLGVFIAASGRYMGRRMSEVMAGPGAVTGRATGSRVEFDSKYSASIGAPFSSGKPVRLFMSQRTQIAATEGMENHPQWTTANAMTSQKPETAVSVVLCTWNNAKRLAITLDAISKCAFDMKWELVVVNNNCSDETDQVVEACREKLPIVYVHETRQGLSRARNAGLSAASGELVVFCR